MKSELRDWREDFRNLCKLYRVQKVCYKLPKQYLINFIECRMEEKLYSGMCAGRVVVLGKLEEKLNELENRLIDRDTNFGMNESYRMAINHVRQAMKEIEDERN